MASSLTDRANITAAIATLASIEAAYNVIDTSLDVALTTFHAHEVSPTAHDDIRTAIATVEDDITILGEDVAAINIDMSLLEARITAIEPTWDEEGNYTGPVAVGLQSNSNFGIEFLSEEDLEELTAAAELAGSIPPV